MRADFEVQGVRVPWLLYGTAWKETRTAALTSLAIAAGFRGIDTANQRKHYLETGVGEALAASPVPRDRIFVQTKFTYARGQDHRLPYDPAASLTTQVQQSFASSLEHLGIDRLDALVLHGPTLRSGWSSADRQVWRAMEDLHESGSVRLLGISNIEYDQLVLLCEDAAVAPAIVQNRCYADTGWDREVRGLCRDRGIVYEGFSLLTANAAALADAKVFAIASRIGATIPQVVLRFANAIGIVALTGTTNTTHMEQDLAALDIPLTPEDIAALETLAG